jgi:transcriptional regulator with XRE-family HTH domain
MKPYAVGVGQRIRQLRLAKAISQKALAKNLGVGNGTVNRWETGKCVPLMPIRCKLAKALGSTVAAIFLERAEHIAVARGKAVSRSIAIFDTENSSAAAVSAANSTLAKANAPDEKPGNASDEQRRQELRAARDEFFRKLARLRAQEG